MLFETRVKTFSTTDFLFDACLDFKNAFTKICSQLSCFGGNFKKQKTRRSVYIIVLCLCSTKKTKLLPPRSTTKKTQSLDETSNKKPLEQKSLLASQ